MRKINQKNILYNDLIIILILSIFLLSYSIRGLYIFLNSFSSIILFFSYFSLLIVNYKEFKCISKNEKGLIIFSLSLVLISGILTTTGIGSIFNIFCLFLMLFISPKIKISKVAKKVLSVIIVINYLIFMMANHTFINPNFVGYINFVYYIYFTIGLNLNDKKNFKTLIFIVIGIITLYFEHLYNCRTAQIITLLFIFLNIFRTGMLNKKWFINFITIALTLGSILCAYTYVQMWKHNFTIDLQMFANKRFYSGRNLIWNECFGLISNNPLFGVGSHYVLKSHFTYALHNSMMTVLTTFGIPVFIIFILQFWHFLKNIYNVVINKNKMYFLILTIICLFGLEYFEAYIYWSLFSINFFIIVVMILNKNGGAYDEKS